MFCFPPTRRSSRDVEKRRGKKRKRKAEIGACCSSISSWSSWPATRLESCFRNEDILKNRGKSLVVWKKWQLLRLWANDEMLYLSFSNPYKTLMLWFSLEIQKKFVVSLPHLYISNELEQEHQTYSVESSFKRRSSSGYVVVPVPFKGKLFTNPCVL